MTDITYIPLNKLSPSADNMRKTGRDTGINELAASITAHGLLQNLTVRPVRDDAGADSGKYEVVAGGRRLAALKLLAKGKAIAKTAPVPCAVLVDGNGMEVSLAENLFQCPPHPADQYEAFTTLHDRDGIAAADIAARFGVTEQVVRQRMKLGAVSPKLIQIYRDGDMTLDQLMGFTITDDHVRQEAVWSGLSYNKSREVIRRMLTEGQVPARDRRAIYVSVGAYEAAGGTVIRDLFDEEGGGYLSDPELLDRLVCKGLDEAAAAIATEGWKWVQVTPEFDYALTAGMRRVYPDPMLLNDEEQARLDTLDGDLEALSVRYEGEVPSPEIQTEFERLESEIAALRDREAFPPDDIAAGGVFVSLGYDGQVRVERGFIRAEDETRAEGGEDDHEQPLAPETEPESDLVVETDEEEAGKAASLSDRLISDLTAHRTAGLRDMLSRHPDTALVAVVHVLAGQAFYGDIAMSCLDIKMTSTSLSGHAPGIAESVAERRIAERHAAWAKRMPREPDALWAFIAGLDPAVRCDLLAHCVGLTVNAVRVPWEHCSRVHAHADVLAQATALDMTAYWTPTVNTYLGRVTKARIIEAVREAVSEEAAERIADMKKQPMAEAAEQLLVGTGWLPTLLRTATHEVSDSDATFSGAADFSVAAE